MNDRIRELAEQCESFGSWDNKTYSFDKEKFAKLIILECANIALREEHDPYECIKKHFGLTGLTK